MLVLIRQHRMLIPGPSQHENGSCDQALWVRVLPDQTLSHGAGSHTLFSGSDCPGIWKQSKPPDLPVNGRGGGGSSTSCMWASMPTSTLTSRQ